MKDKIKKIFDSLSLTNLEFVNIKPERKNITFSDGKDNSVYAYRLEYSYKQNLGDATGGSILIDIDSSDDMIKKKILEIQQD